MKKRKKFSIGILFFLISLVIILLIEENKISTYIGEKIKERLLEKLKIKLFYDNIHFSIFKGFSLKNVFITDNQGKLLFKAKEVLLIPKITSINKKIKISKLWINNAEFYIELFQKNNSEILNLKKIINKISSYINHIIITDFTITLYTTNGKFHFTKVFLDALIDEKLEFLFRFHQNKDNFFKIMGYSNKNLALNGELNIKNIPEFLTFLKQINILKNNNLNLTPSGTVSGNFDAIYSFNNKKLEYSMDLDLKNITTNFKNIALKKIYGNLYIDNEDIELNINGKIFNSEFNIKTKKLKQYYICKGKITKLFFEDIKKIPDLINKNLYISGIGKANFDLKFTDINNINGKIDLKIGALEFQNYNFSNANLKIKLSKDKLSLTKGQFLFGPLWDVTCTGEVTIKPEFNIKIPFYASNHLMPDTIWEGTINKNKESTIINSIIRFKKYTFPFIIDFKKLPEFKGTLDFKYINANWIGETFLKKREWLALVEFESTYPLIEKLTGSMSLKKNKEKIYEIRNGKIKGKYIKGNFNGYLGATEGSLKITLSGNTQAFKEFKKFQDFNNLNFTSKITLSGGFLNPNINIIIKTPYGIISGNSDFKKLKIDCNLFNISLLFDYDLLKKDWNIKSNTKNINPELLKILKQYFKKNIPLFKKMVFNFKGCGNKTTIKELNFDLNIEKIKDFYSLSNLKISGHIKDKILTLKKLTLTSSNNGNINLHQNLWVDVYNKNAKIHLNANNYKISLNNNNDIFINGTLDFSIKNNNKFLGNLNIEGILVYNKKEYPFKIITSFKNHNLIINQLDLFYKNLKNFKGICNFTLFKDKLIIQDTNIKNENFYISTNIYISKENIEKFSIKFQDLKLKNSKINLLYYKNKISGTINISKESLKKLLPFDKIPPISIKGELQNNKGHFKVMIDYNDNPIDAESLLNIKYNPKKIYINGDLFIKNSTIFLKNNPEIDFNSIDFSPFYFNINVNIGENVWIKNPMFNSEIFGKFTVSGINYPSITFKGNLEMKRGTILYFTQYFEIITGKIFYQSLEFNNNPDKKNTKKINISTNSKQFKAEYIYSEKKHEIIIDNEDTLFKDQTNIYISILAYKKINNIDVYMQVSGPISNMKILFYSNPEIPPDKLQQLVQGNNTIFSNKEFSENQLKETLKFNIQSLLFSQMSNDIAKKLSLQELEFRKLSNNDLNSKEYNIKLGKYLSPKFYFRYYYKQTQYYNEQQQFEIQYQTNKHLFLEGLYDEYKEDYRFGLQYSISF